MFVHPSPAFRVGFLFYVIMLPGWSCCIHLSGFSPLPLFVLHNSHRVPGLLLFFYFYCFYDQNHHLAIMYAGWLSKVCCPLPLFPSCSESISQHIYNISDKFKFILNTLSASSRIIFKDSLAIIRLVAIDAMIEQITLAITISIFSPLYV